MNPPKIALSRGCLILLWSFSAFLAAAELRIQGSDLGTATMVTVDGADVPFKVLDEATLIIILKAPPPENARIVVVTPGGQVEQRLAGPKPPPGAPPPLQLTAVMPTSGPQSGATSLVLQGEGFRRTPREIQVLLGGRPARSVVVNSERQLTMETPPHEGGLVDIEIRAADGTAVVLKEAYRYVSAPQIQSMTPKEGPVAGGTRVEIRGSGFATEGNLLVRFNQSPVQEITRRSEGVIEVLAPASVEGAAEVTLTNPDGQTALLPGGFTYRALPTIRTMALTPG